MIEEELEDELEEEPDEEEDDGAEITLPEDVQEILRSAYRDPSGKHAQTEYTGDIELAGEFFAIAYRVERPTIFAQKRADKLKLYDGEDQLTERRKFKQAAVMLLNKHGDLCSQDIAGLGGSNDWAGVAYTVYHPGAKFARADQIVCLGGNRLAYQALVKEDPDDESAWENQVKSVDNAVFKPLLTGNGGQNILKKVQGLLDEKIRIEIDTAFNDLGERTKEEETDEMISDAMEPGAGKLIFDKVFSKSGDTADAAKAAAARYLEAFDVEEYELSARDKRIVSNFIEAALKALRVVDSENRFHVIAETLLWGRLSLSKDNQEVHWPELVKTLELTWYGAPDTWDGSSPTSMAETLPGVVGNNPYAGALGYVDLSQLGNDKWSAGTEWKVDTLAQNINTAIANAAAPGDDKDDTTESGWGVEGVVAKAIFTALETTRVWQEYRTLLRAVGVVMHALMALQNDGKIDDDEMEGLEEAGKDASVSELSDMITGLSKAHGMDVSDLHEPTTDEGKKNREKEKHKAQDIRTSVRDYLTINTPFFAAMRETRVATILNEAKPHDPGTGASAAKTFAGVYSIEGNAAAGINLLTLNKDQQTLLDLTPSEVSSLVPMLRIFKIYNEDGKGPSGPVTKEIELPFENNTINNKTATNANKNFIESGYNRGNGVGIRSFEWEYQGTNPANDTKDIVMTLTLHFQSFTDIVKERTIGGQTFSYADLITRPKALRSVNAGSGTGGDYATNQSWNAEYYRVKFLVGHAYSDKAAGDIIPKEKRMAIDTTAIPIIATLIDHRFDIQEDGSVNLIVSYRGYLEAMAFSSQTNIFADAEMQETFTKAQELVAAVLAACVDDQKLSTQLGKELSWFGKELQQATFSSIVNLLRGNQYVYYIYPKISDLILRGVIDGEDSIYPQAEDSSTGKSTAEAIIDAANKSISKCDADVTKCIDDIFTKNVDVVSNSPGGRKEVPFFYVGDLIKVVKQHVEGGYSVAMKSAGSASRAGMKNTRVVLTDLPFNINLTQDDVPKYQNINLGDIPISLESFTVWFVDRIIKFQGNKQFPEYSFGLFMNEFLREVLSKFKNFQDNDGASKALTPTTMIAMRQAYAPADAIGECQALCEDRAFPGPWGGQGPRMTFADFVPSPGKSDGKCTAITRIVQKNRSSKGPSESVMQAYSKKAMENWINFMLFYPVTTSAHATFPTPNAKNLESFYQFNFGVNSGMVKRITFAKDDQPYVREARFFAAETNWKNRKLFQLREPYKLTIETFGLPNIFPGSVCFIDPRTIDFALGAINNTKSVSWMLGLGGYHMITHVKNSIRSGEFSTSITAKWTSHGALAKPEVTTTDAVNRPKNSSIKVNCDLGSGEKRDEALKKIDEAFNKTLGAGSAPFDLTNASDFDKNLAHASAKVIATTAVREYLESKAKKLN